MIILSAILYEHFIQIGQFFLELRKKAQGRSFFLRHGVDLYFIQCTQGITEKKAIAVETLCCQADDDLRKKTSIQVNNINVK